MRSASALEVSPPGATGTNSLRRSSAVSWLIPSGAPAFLASADWLSDMGFHCTFAGRSRRGGYEGWVFRETERAGELLGICNAGRLQGDRLAEPDEEDGEERHGDEAEQQRLQHDRRQAAAALSDHRRVIAAPELHGVMNDGQDGRAQDAERRREALLRFARAREAAQKGECAIDEHCEEQAGQAWVPSPIDAPGLLGPERSARQNEQAERDRDLGPRLRPGVAHDGGPH